MLPKYLKKQIDEYMTSNEYNEDNLTDYLRLLGKSKDAKPRTYVTRMSYFKKYITDTYNDLVGKGTLANIKADDTVYDKINQENDEHRAAKDNFIIYPQLIKSLEKTEQSSEYIPAIVFAMYVSGRRINEILNDTYKVTKIRGKKGLHTIKFSHLSKQKSNPEPAEVHLNPIITSTDFISRLKHIRKTKSTLELTVNELTKQVDRYLKKIDSNLSPHKIRGIYALIMYENSDKKQNINGFITHILHHQSTDTSLNYSNYIFSK